MIAGLSHAADFDFTLERCLYANDKLSSTMFFGNASGSANQQSISMYLGATSDKTYVVTQKCVNCVSGTYSKLTYNPDKANVTGN